MRPASSADLLAWPPDLRRLCMFRKFQVTVTDTFFVFLLFLWY
jgi:hypothetical protein